VALDTDKRVVLIEQHQVELVVVAVLDRLEQLTQAAVVVVMLQVVVLADLVW
tara:strand:+ start:452 stop:607 length:156 start_codon:yes stop_codon:yes gene_type:complete